MTFQRGRAGEQVAELRNGRVMLTSHPQLPCTAKGLEGRTLDVKLKSGVGGEMAEATEVVEQARCDLLNKSYH
jgi:hypothetical protein